MREVKDKNNWALFSFFLVIAMIAVGYFVINPYVNDVKSLNTKIDAKGTENQELEAKLASLQKLKKEFEENADTTKMLDLALPDNDMLAEVIESIRAIGEDSVVKITSIKQNQTKNSESTDIVISFESSYSSFKMFLDDVESNVRFVTPTKITLNETKNSEGGESFLKGSINLNFFKVSSKKTSGNTQMEDINTKEGQL